MDSKQEKDKHQTQQRISRSIGNSSTSFSSHRHRIVCPPAFGNNSWWHQRPNLKVGIIEEEFPSISCSLPLQLAEVSLYIAGMAVLCGCAEFRIFFAVLRLLLTLSTWLSLKEKNLSCVNQNEKGRVSTVKYLCCAPGISLSESGCYYCAVQAVETFLGLIV